MNSTDGIRGPLALLLAGPLIWSGHFVLVYLVTEAVCGMDGWQFRWFEVPGVSVLVTALTVLALLATAWYAYLGWHEWRAGGEGDETVGGFVGLGGLLLSLLFLVGVGFVGLPALLLPPC
jgi:hypothetical protein